MKVMLVSLTSIRETTVLNQMRKLYNIDGAEYSEPGAIIRSLGERSQLTHTLIKLLDFPQQQKFQYNDKTEKNS